MKLIFIIFSLSIFHLSGSSINPMVFIPGIGASQMEVKMDDTAEIPDRCKTKSKDYFTLWINTIYCLTHTPACVFEVLRLNYDKTKRVTSNRRGIYTQIPGFGSTDKSRYLDTTAFLAPYIKTLMNRMIEEGYTPGLTIKVAPYDFRKAPHEQMDYFRRLKQLIEDTYDKNGEQKIILMVHSLGGLMSMMFLRRQPQQWKDQYIKSLISLSVGWAGTVKAIEAYMKGFSFRLGEFTPKCSFSSKPLMEQTHDYITLPKLSIIPADILRTIPSIIWLFPSSKAWGKTDVLVRSRTPDEKTYTLNNMQEFFTDLGNGIGWEMYNDIELFQKEISDPGVKMHCLYGTNIHTISLVDHSTSYRDLLNFPISGDGDGLVNLQSLEVCKKWSKETTRVKTKSFSGVTHQGLIGNSEVLNHIVYIINND